MRVLGERAVPAVAMFVYLTGFGPIRSESWDLKSLRALAELTAEQWQAVLRGEPQAKVLDTQEKREVAIVGVARARANTACFVTLLQDIGNFKKNPAVLQIRKLASPLDPRDLAEFTFGAADIAALRSCRVGSCDVKLPARLIERLQHEVDWSSPNHAVSAQRLIREEMFGYLKRYQDRGNPALIEYRDKSKPVRLEEEFRAVLDGRPGLAQFVPEFQGYLARNHGAPLPGVSDFLYWSNESFGLKPVMSITHVSIYAQPGRAVVASKQIYASHYFDSSIGLTAALDETSGSGMYLAYLNRSRIDFLGGLFGGVRRALARGRLREGMRKNLVETVRRLESSCATNPTAAPTAK